MDLAHATEARSPFLIARYRFPPKPTMRRNLDLVRWILIEVEANSDPFEFVTPAIEGFTEVEVSYHISLMEQAGLISARDRSAIGVYFWGAGQLTFSGHELLESARDEALWHAAKERVEAACGGEIFALLHETLLDRQRERVAAAQPTP